MKKAMKGQTDTKAPAVLNSKHFRTKPSFVAPELEPSRSFEITYENKIYFTWWIC